jgi:hypothetical protein
MQEAACTMRKKWRIYYRPPFLVQLLGPGKRDSHMLYWLMYGRIKGLIFSDESRLCRGPACLSGSEFAGVSGLRRDYHGRLFCGIGFGFKSALFRASKSIDFDEDVRMGLPSRLLEVQHALWTKGAVSHGRGKVTLQPFMHGWRLVAMQWSSLDSA